LQFFLLVINIGALPQPSVAIEFSIENSRDLSANNTNFSRRCPLAMRATELLRNSQVLFLNLPLNFGALSQPPVAIEFSIENSRDLSANNNQF